MLEKYCKPETCIIFTKIILHARDALLLCMTLSKRHDEVGKHIARNTNFCPVSMLIIWNDCSNIFELFGNEMGFIKC